MAFDELPDIGVQVVSEKKKYQFSILIAEKENTATTLRWPKHNVPMCKRIYE